MDDELYAHYSDEYIRRLYMKRIQITMEYKIKRNKNLHDKFYEEREKQKRDLKSGLTYQLEMTLQLATRRVEELSLKGHQRNS